jgi:hypothetical protein
MMSDSCSFRILTAKNGLLPISGSFSQMTIGRLRAGHDSTSVKILAYVCHRLPTGSCPTLPVLKTTGSLSGICGQTTTIWPGLGSRDISKACLVLNIHAHCLNRRFLFRTLLDYHLPVLLIEVRRPSELFHHHEVIWELTTEKENKNLRAISKAEQRYIGIRRWFFDGSISEVPPPEISFHGVRAEVSCRRVFRATWQRSRPRGTHSIRGTRRGYGPCTGQLRRWAKPSQQDDTGAQHVTNDQNRDWRHPAGIQPPEHAVKERIAAPGIMLDPHVLQNDQKHNSLNTFKFK